MNKDLDINVTRLVNEDRKALNRVLRIIEMIFIRFVKIVLTFLIRFINYEKKVSRCIKIEKKLITAVYFLI